MSDKVNPYDFRYNLRRDEALNGFVNIDPYSVAKVWNLGTKDPSGCLFHILKTVAKLGNLSGDSLEVEIQSLEATLQRYRNVRKINEFEIDPEEYSL
jgi:hypothetical protein